MPKSIKTAVSLPEPVYRKAEAARRKSGRSRSGLYAAALQMFLKAQELRDQEDRYAAGYKAKPDDLGEIDALTQAGAALFDKEDW